MTPEDDEFNRIEREADMRLKAVRATLADHMAHLRANMSEYERGVIDGMQKQMQSSVDKAVNAMAAQKEWQGLMDEEIDPEDSEQVATLFDIAPALAKEVVFENDEATWYDETPEQRWVRMRAWVEQSIKAGERGDATT